MSFLNPKFIFPIIFSIASLYICFYVWTAVAIYFHPIRTVQNQITSHLEVTVGENAKTTNLIFDTATCSYISERKVIPAPPGGAPFDVVNSFSIATNIENPPHISKHDTVPNIPLIFTFELPTEHLTPGRYIWVDRTSYYCNIFNYILGPIVEFTIPEFVVINPKQEISS